MVGAPRREASWYVAHLRTLVTFGVLAVIVPSSSEAHASGRDPDENVPAPAPTSDVVLLKDGTSIKGKILRLEAGKFVVIRGANGVEQTLSWDEVSRVQRVSSSTETPTVTTEKSRSGFVVTGALDEAEARRQAWIRRGGTIVGYDVAANGSMLYQPDAPYANVQRNGTLTQAKSTLFGVGFGGAAHISLLGLSPPDVAQSSTTWTAWRLGTGIDFSYFTISPPGDAGFTISATQISVPVAAGGQVGLGTFRLDEAWHGVMLGADYRPSFTYFSSNGASSSNLNWAGFQLTADVTSFRAAVDARTAEAQFRISFVLLPPVGDSKLLFVTVGLGAVWY